MIKKCKTCMNCYPSISCVNCGTGLVNYSPYKPPTNADRIRSMSDEELAEFLLEWISCDKEGFMCHPKEYKEGGKCNGRCVAGRIDWLRQPAEEETT